VNGYRGACHKKYNNREEAFQAFYGSYYDEVKPIECEPDVVDVKNHVHRLIILV
jgi:viroplasmin and RNaseH domain-containing protein